uniref:peroxidase n=1 Tax=Quercus lobata TaxID=97700 RepID=A0A7N2MXF9_QUELO
MESACLIQTSLLVFLLLSLSVSYVHCQATSVGFYSKSCPRAESIVRSTVQAHFQSNPTVAPGLLRMHFHDCFVQGCDASVLVDGPNTEKTAGPNLGLRGYEVIDDAKTKLEAACPGVVSCADILALAARDSVVLTNGPNWQVPTGRKDGRVSLASDTTDLPGFTESIDAQKKKFSAKGLNAQDLVTLVGGHTIGTSACQFFQYRLYNFTTTGNGADPTINPSFLPQLRALCPQNGDATRRVGLDTGSQNRFDSSFFSNLRTGRGVLESDQKLWTDASTRSFVQSLLGSNAFNVQFGKSMVKMSNIGLKSGTQGEIRKCLGFYGHPRVVLDVELTKLDGLLYPSSCGFGFIHFFLDGLEWRVAQVALQFLECCFTVIRLNVNQLQGFEGRKTLICGSRDEPIEGRNPSRPRLLEHEMRRIPSGRHRG